MPVNNTPVVHVHRLEFLHTLALWATMLLHIVFPQSIRVVAYAIYDATLKLRNSFPIPFEIVHLALFIGFALPIFGLFGHVTVLKLKAMLELYRDAMPAQDDL